MSPSAFVWLQRLLPQRLLGRFIYRLSRSERKWIKSPLVAWFARQYEIDLDDARVPDLEAYPSFNAFFTRELRAGARTIDTAPDAIVSPVDGRLTEFGALSDGRLLQAKGFDYALTELIGETAPGAWSTGSYATAYLSPRDYHRVHMPFPGTLRRLRYIAGRRYSVNAATATQIKDLFCRNERLVCWLDGSIGTFAVVLVGALNVASFSTPVTGEIASAGDRAWQDLAPIDYAHGDLLATFNLGSTVVLLFPSGAVEWQSQLRAGQRITLGHRIGTVRTPVDT